MKKYLFSIVLIASLFVVGCATPTVSNKDFNKVVSYFVENLEKSQKLRTNKPYVLIVTLGDSNVGEYEQDVFIKKMRTALTQKHLALVTNFQGNKMIMDSRKLRASEEMNQANVAGKGQLIAPELNLMCTLTREEGRFFFHISLTKLSDGLVLWEDGIEL